MHHDPAVVPHRNRDKPSPIGRADLESAYLSAASGMGDLGSKAVLAELDDLVLLHPFAAVDDDDAAVTLPEGATGTVVSVLGGGRGYTVEFDAPVHALIELAAEDIRGLGEGSREHLAARLPR